MNDIQKDPIKAGQPAPHKDNSGLKVLAIVLAIIFGLPIVLLIILLIFISVNFDKFTEWADEHLSSFLESAYVLDVEQRDSVENVYNAISDSKEDKTITKSECQNIRDIARKANLDFMTASYCDSQEILAGSEESNGTKSLYFWDDSGVCGALDFRNDFFTFSGYRITYGLTDRSSCKADKSVKIDGISGKEKQKLQKIEDDNKEAQRS
ncbi:MAG: hypothetical protein MJ154_03585 [Candidatus Saccharibacteria bacterium]|nr:hypothetical protein [Candidatus Saccharibacteria bacterium]